MNKLRTLEEANAWFGHHGISISQWSRDHGFSHPLVREVLAGRKKGLRGQAHNIAIALGLKRGVPTNKPGRIQRDHDTDAFGFKKGAALIGAQKHTGGAA